MKRSLYITSPEYGYKGFKKSFENRSANRIHNGFSIIQEINEFDGLIDTDLLNCALIRCAVKEENASN